MIPDQNKANPVYMLLAEYRFSGSTLLSLEVKMIAIITP
jgi:hypothetical protein